MKSSLFKDFQLIDNFSAFIIVKKWYQFSYCFYEFYTMQRENDMYSDFLLNCKFTKRHLESVLKNSIGSNKIKSKLGCWLANIKKLESKVKNVYKE